jgi:hypothetical protein
MQQLTIFNWTPIDTYNKTRGLNGFNQVLEVFSGFSFLMKEGLQIIEGKNSNHIINESVNTNTCACGICWLEWRKVKEVLNVIVDCVNIESMIIDEIKTLEKSNSATS